MLYQSCEKSSTLLQHLVCVCVCEREEVGIPPNGGITSQPNHDGHDSWDSATA